jgi:nucleolin
MTGTSAKDGEEHEGGSHDKVATKDASDIHDLEGETSKRKRKRKRKDTKNKAEAPALGDGEESRLDESSTVPEKERTLFMEGLPFACTPEEVRAFFEVEHDCTDILDLKLPTWNDTGRLRGYGHIVFKNMQSAKTCQDKVDGKNLQGRYIKLAQAKGRKEDNDAGKVPPRTQPEGCSSVFVKNLPYEITEEDLASIFSHCGKIMDMPQGVRLARDSMTEKPKGFGYVDFKNPDGAYAAVHKASKGNGITIKGRRILVDYEENKAKGSFKTRDGKNWHKENKDNSKKSFAPRDKRRKL